MCFPAVRVRVRKSRCDVFWSLTRTFPRCWVKEKNNHLVAMATTGPGPQPPFDLIQEDP